MDSMNKDRLEQLSAKFKAMAHPTRLWMVEQLIREEHSVCDLVAALNLDHSTVSKHLSILKQAFIIKDEKRGKHVYYSLRADCMSGIIQCMEEKIKYTGQVKV
ncbi:MAG: metalloregulator ArsR/SmtB family transcription factor [FCB group bacterium]|nr:metalloregulator ArsR/SmtB family transcription factor [FCB group bacterium]